MNAYMYYFKNNISEFRFNIAFNITRIFDIKIKNSDALKYITHQNAMMKFSISIEVRNEVLLYADVIHYFILL